MPGFDATGPWGRGPGTGWGRGPCGAGLRRGGGRGWGMGPGAYAGGRPRWGWGAGGYGAFRGRGFGPFGLGPFGPGGAYGYESPQQEAQALKEEEGYLRSELEALQKRIAQLEQQAGTE
jgi:hypothetical protein